MSQLTNLVDYRRINLDLQWVIEHFTTEADWTVVPGYARRTPGQLWAFLLTAEPERRIRIMTRLLDAAEELQNQTLLELEPVPRERLARITWAINQALTVINRPPVESGGGAYPRRSVSWATAEAPATAEVFVLPGLEDLDPGSTGNPDGVEGPEVPEAPDPPGILPLEDPHSEWADEGWRLGWRAGYEACLLDGGLR